jgi:transposase InsO family protein
VVGEVYHHSRGTFCHFTHKYDYLSLLTHANEESRFKYLDQLSKGGIVYGLPHIQYTDRVFHGYILGKHPKEKFNICKLWRASSLIELVHSEITGPFTHPSTSKDKYVLTFIDGFLRCTWVYFLKLKYEVFECLKYFKYIVEDQIGKIIKNIHTHNGEGYVNKDVEHLCSESGIDFPQQNGVVERKNMTLKEMANYMLHARALPPMLWVESIKCEAYIQNIFPNKSVKVVTPYYAWRGKKS